MPRIAKLSLVPLAVVVALPLAGCEKTLDQGDAQKFVKNNIHPTPTKVSCPGDVKEKKGKDFTCKLTLPNGHKGTVTVHQTDGKGHVTFGQSDINLH